ncbi:MAG TPA: hypothetical protein VLL82_12915 [Mycobacterium sp.]|nr:hypothetical protein [Mycobacterium sp.]
MALDQYINQTRSLLNDVGGVEYTTPDLTNFINEARVQIAGASESIRQVALLALIAAEQTYPLSAFTGLTTGTQGVLTVRKLSVLTPTEWTEVHNREWEWFWSNCLSGPVSFEEGTPNTFAQLQVGFGGILYFSPIPLTNAEARADVVCYPMNLDTDGDPEALQYPWTEAVQYYAAYLALLNAQRYADADSMLQRYDLFQTRATQMTTPTTLPGQYPGQGGAAIAGEARPITAQRGGQG